MSRPANQLRRGLVALAKSTLLVLGVPFVLVRLWILAPVPRHVASVADTGFWAHVVIALVAVLWLVASFQLARELAAALRGGSEKASSWSGRWAAAIASLLVLGGILSLVSSRAVDDRRPTAVHRLADIASSTAPTTKSEVLRERECLLDLADRALGDPLAWSELAKLNRDELQPDGRRFVDPSFVGPGWCVRLPASGHPKDESHSPTAAGRSTSSTERLFALELLGLGILATSALSRRLRTLRRRRECERRTGERAAHRPARRRGILRELDTHASATLIDWLERANKALMEAVASAPTSTPSIRLVRAGPSGIDFYLESPLLPPRGFSSNDEGHTWHFALRNDPARLERGGRYLPWLVPIGEDDEAVYLLPIGPGAMLSVCGDPQSVDQALTGIALSLRTLPWAEELGVELFGIEASSDLERCYQLNRSSRAALVALSNEELREPREQLCPTWRREPLVVVARSHAGELSEKLLRDLCLRAGVVSAGERAHPLSTARLFVANCRGVLEPGGLSLRVPQPSDEQMAIVDDLLEAASAPAEVVALDDLAGAGPTSALRTTLFRIQAGGQPPRLGAPGPLELSLLSTRPALIGHHSTVNSVDLDRIVELVAFLHLHGGSAGRATLSDALFAHRRSRKLEGQLDNLVAVARRALVSEDVSASLISSNDSAISLSPDLSCDWARFCDAVTTARSQEPDVAIALLDAALGLVSGTPFADLPPGYGWLFDEQFGEEIIAEVIDASHHLANLALAGGKHGLARSAIEKGRSIEPGSEILARDLMVLCDVLGERNEIDVVFDELEAVLFDLGANEPSAETRALYVALTGASR